MIFVVAVDGVQFGGRRQRIDDFRSAFPASAVIIFTVRPAGSVGKCDTAEGAVAENAFGHAVTCGVIWSAVATSQLLGMDDAPISRRFGYTLLAGEEIACGTGTGPRSN